MKDYYVILGVDSKASLAEIKKAFRRAAKQHHPDAGGQEAAFKIINEAYEVLSDSQKRARYDRTYTPPKPSRKKPSIHVSDSNINLGKLIRNGVAIGSFDVELINFNINDDIFSVEWQEGVKPNWASEVRAAEKGVSWQVEFEVYALGAEVGHSSAVIELTLEFDDSCVNAEVFVEFEVEENKDKNAMLPRHKTHGQSAIWRSKSELGKIEQPLDPTYRSTDNRSASKEESAFSDKTHKHRSFDWSWLSIIIGKPKKVIVLSALVTLVLFIFVNLGVILGYFDYFGQILSRIQLNGYKQTTQPIYSEEEEEIFCVLGNSLKFYPVVLPGETALVWYGGDYQDPRGFLRSSPDWIEENVTLVLPKGARVQVIEGPICKESPDFGIWFLVNYNGTEGWVAQTVGTASIQFLGLAENQ